MAKITLARAFVLRGFFRKTITELNQEIRSENLTSEIDDSKSFFKVIFLLFFTLILNLFCLLSFYHKFITTKL